MYLFAPNQCYREMTLHSSKIGVTSLEPFFNSQSNLSKQILAQVKIQGSLQNYFLQNFLMPSFNNEQLHICITIITIIVVLCCSLSY